MGTGTKKTVRATSAYCTEMHPCAEGGKQIMWRKTGRRDLENRQSDFEKVYGNVLLINHSGTQL